jgi:hypothetical protein
MEPALTVIFHVNSQTGSLVNTSLLAAECGGQTRVTLTTNTVLVWYAIPCYLASYQANHKYTINETD